MPINLEFRKKGLINKLSSTNKTMNQIHNSNWKPQMNQHPRL